MAGSDPERIANGPRWGRSAEFEESANTPMVSSSRCRTSFPRRAARERRTHARPHLLWLTLLVFAGLVVVRPAFAAPTVWVAPAMVRVRPDDAPGGAAQINLYAAKGESESFQIIVNAPAGGLSSVNVTAPDLGGPQVTLYREHYVYLASGSGDWASNRNKPQGPGWYPDALIPFVDPSTGQDLTGAYDAVPFSLAAGKNQPIWVDISVPRTTTAGQYSGVFTVTSAQGAASVTLHLTVWNFTLPIKPALKTCFMYWPTSDGGENRGVWQADRELLKNRINPVTTNSSYERSFIDNDGMQSLSLSFWSAADQSGYIAPAPSVSDVLAQKAQHQPDLYFYCYSADEISNPALYSGIKAWGRAFHAAGVDQLITMVPVPELYDDGSGTGRSAVDDWVLLPKQYDAYQSNVLYVQQKGDKVWSYNCTQQDDYSPKWLLDYAPINYRIQPGFINQSLGLVGLLYWRVDWWNVNPWTGAYPWPYLPGEGLLTYPGAQVGLPGQVVPAMRIKYVRDGVDDYDYVQLLKNAGQGAWALSVARTVGPDWTNWTRDPNAVEAARIQLGNMLDSLGGGGGGDTVTVTASASPSTVASGGTSTLNASATDSRGHAIASWSWSDGGAGGNFSPSTAVQNPTYTAPANTSTSNLTVLLTVTATCSGAPPAAGSASTALTVQGTATSHTVTASASASPTTVASGGTTTLTATVTDSLGHTGEAWSWSDNGAGGTFLPSAGVQNPTYQAAANTSGADRTVTLTVTSTCMWFPQWVADSADVTITVNPEAPATHTLTVTASASPTTVASGGTTTLTATATDSLGHTGEAWAWSDNSAGGTFLPSASVQNPTYQAAANTSGADRTVTLTVTSTCEWLPQWVLGSAEVTLTVSPRPGLSFSDVPPDYWAFPQIMACVAGGLVSGFDDGTYRPAQPVSRDQMAVFVSRALAGGDAGVPDGPALPTFPDVPTDQWAYKYVEYAAANHIVAGFPGGDYRPALTVDRGQMAVFMARAIVHPTGDEGLAGYTPPTQDTFSDVPASYWAHKYVEYLASRGVVGGYGDGTYRPDVTCARDQMAVYLTRAFALTP